MNLPSLKQVQYFCAVVELRHFGRAAERCFVTQSTLSAGIQEMESCLGVQLLERTKRQVLVTPIGLQIYQKAVKLLEDAAAMGELAEQDKGPLTGPLRLGCIPTIGPFFLPRVLPGVRAQYDQLQLYLIEDQTKGCLARLQAGDLDAAILALPYDIGNLQFQEIWNERFYAAIPPGHPLSGKGAIASVDLPGDELLLLEEGHCLRDHVLSVCHLKPQSSSTFYGTSLYTLLEMVAGGQGITLVPEMALSTELASNMNVSFRPLSDKGPHRQISLVWRRTLAKVKQMQVLADKMQSLIEANVDQ